MENKQLPKGYEQMGQWYVNLTIPQNARDFLRRSFDMQLKGEVPDGEAYFYAKMARTCLESGIFKIIREAVGANNSKELEALLNRHNDEKDPGVFADIARLWVKGVVNTSKSSKTYVEHCLAHSTCEIPPDPFADMGSYFKGGIIDGYERTKENGIISRFRTLYTRSPIELFIEQAKIDKNISEEEILYDVKITIDCRTREARIDPAPPQS